jgi:predicted GNAT superfamily acetyltransferase
MAEGIKSAAGPDIVIRPVDDVREMKIAVDLQRRVWGYSDIDTVPEAMFVVAKSSGGQVLGAFHGGGLIGFALAFVGIHCGKTYLHSHMVGVVPEYQDRGVGRLLKLNQREDAIARGIALLEWTFDPLQLKNAYFNLVRLGAIVRRYIPNFYGQTSSPLQAGLPTDRLVAEWWVESARVQDALSGKKRIDGSAGARISVPVAIRELCSSDPPEAEKIQSRVRDQFERRIADGLTAVGFEFDHQQGSYVLGPYED